LEVMIALPILAFVSMAMVAAMIYASRLSRITSNQMAAKNIAQSYFERMAIDDYEDVTPQNYPSVTAATSPPLYLDGVRGTRCYVDIVVTGYGEAEAGSANALTDNEANWRPNEWVGDTLFLVGGRGRGQKARIVGNTANTVTVDGALNPVPIAGTQYEINGGKTVRITTRWKYLEKNYTATIESLVINWGPRR
jgi:hypothetical protein